VDQFLGVTRSSHWSLNLKLFLGLRLDADIAYVGDCLLRV